MRFDTSQHMRLSQQMKLGPRMIQSMEILQMPMIALQERIEQELESNVALELVEPGALAAPEDEEEERREGAEDDRAVDRIGERELRVGEDSPAEWQRLSELESSYGDAFDNEYSSARFQPGERDRKLDAMANVAARGESLAEQLRHQWSFAEVDEDVARAGQIIIDYIGPDGILGADLATILDQNQNVPGIALTAALLERALAEVQQWLDPPGVGARDKRECLLLQAAALLEHLGSHERTAEDHPDDEHERAAWEDVVRLIRDHFDDLLQNRLPRIAEAAHLPLERIQAAIGLMRRLNLSPGKDLVDEDVPPVMPDVIVEYDEDLDAYTARLASGVIPTLAVSERYRQMARDRSQAKGTREFIATNVRNAQWLIDSINQRKATLLRVVNVVLARQREWFDKGPQYLKPLPMIEVADQLGIHVGTVSRAVADKWIETPRGMAPLRKFFSGGTATESGRDMSWDAVKATLKEIVAAEDRTSPLSDEALARELKKRGIDIARRTVVKYRQQLDIPPARRRKVFA
jgi:RNA polymerase sigma-54 factor